ncbi:hypothetical protein ES703_79937 [subsurface metagenome]
MSHFPPDEIRKPLAKIVSDLSRDDFVVKEIYTKGDREEYVDKFNESELPDESQRIPKWNINTDKPPVGPRKKGTKTIPLSSERKTLIPTRCKLHIDQERINALYHELRKLPMKNYVNLVAIAFRVFFELSVDKYIERVSLAKHKDDSLSNRINKVAKYMKDNNLLKPEQLKPLSVAISSRHNILHPNTLNAFVHNEYIHPNEGDLKNAWDNIEPFISKIWETE